MTWLKFETIEDFNTFEKTYCYNGFQWTLANRYDADGFAWDVIDKVKIPSGDITLENYDPDRTPLLYRKQGVLNKENGYTKAIHSAKEGTDGKFYCRKVENNTIPEVLDEDGNVLRAELTIPYGDLYAYCTGFTEQETDPEFPSEDE